MICFRNGAACAIVVAVTLAALAGSAFAQASADALEQEFKNPPDAAKPRTWWHWTRGNVTKEGITKDLEWMKRVGIAGMQLADVGAGQGQTVEPKIEFGSVAWLDAVRFTAEEAKRLNLEMTIFSSAGWSETGGPWVKPEQAMKKLVWSEAQVEGPRRFAEKLPAPPSNNGSIRNLADRGTGDPAKPDVPFYADSTVIAYRTPEGESDFAALHPAVTTHNGPIDATPLLDDDLNSSLTVAAPTGGGAAWVQFEFAQPFTARAFTLAGKAGIPVGRLLASDDGKAFRLLVTLPGAQLYRQGHVRTFAFPETTAKFYRIEMTGAPLRPAATMAQTPSEPAKQYELSEAKLFTGARVHRWEEKASFSFLFEYDSVPTPAISPSLAIPDSGVVDLTSKMTLDGNLAWDVPPGKWTILRLGYSLTGAKNRPAPPSGSGYEADKLSRNAMESYFHGYMDPLEKALGPLLGTTLRFMMMDSWEAGYQNWTNDMMVEFRRRRGYELTPFLPVLAGRVVKNADVSDRVLWDFRRTLADLFAEYHYGTMADLLQKKGLGVYAEAAGVSLEIPEDTLLNKSKVTIPMGEFWVRDLHPRLMYYQDVRGAASASHVYAKNFVAAEAFTGGGFESPYTLKKVADYWFAQGVNRLVFHTSAHQPLDTPPGNTMVGTHLHRNITWAEQAKPFMTYVARTSHLLQQGKFVADVAYLLDEGAPSTMPIWGVGLKNPPPEGYDYDYVNADVVLSRISTGADGRLTLPDGMTYGVLVLPDTHHMRPEVLKKIRDLVMAGATVVGPRPLSSPSFQRYPEADREVQALAGEVWGDLDGESRTIRRVGKGTVAWGMPLKAVLEAKAITRDVECVGGLDAEFVWLHRRTDDAEIYFISNQTDQPQELKARFRVAGREAELWSADTGEIRPAAYSYSHDKTVVPLKLAERESVFVVFRKKTDVAERVLSSVSNRTLTTLSGPWEMTFPSGLGAPAKTELNQLQSWTENADGGIKYFSGHATYHKALNAESDWFRAGERRWLDLGKVDDLAQVTLNGKTLELLWKAPYRVDVTDALQPGENHLEITVTNEWTNRLVGDRNAPAGQKVLGDSGVSPSAFGAPMTTPPESGLLGPVTLFVRTVQ